MTNLYRTAALALVMSASGLAAAQAQNNGEETASAPDYCDREWVALDGNEDGFISGKEASSALEARFDAIDADDNGKVTKTEYVDCKASNGMKAADAGRDEETFKAADADGNQTLSRREYGDAAATAYEEALATDDAAEPFIVVRRFIFLTPEEAARENAIADMSGDEIASRSVRNFSFLDADDNGEIAMSEWRVQTPRVGMSEEDANAQFSELDGNGDDTITRKEYEAAVGKSASSSSASDDAEASPNEQTANRQSSDAPGVPVFVWWYE